MRFDVISLFPPMLLAVTEYGVTGRAVRRGTVAIKVWNPRDYATDAYRTVDDRPYGGGPGMVMKYEPLRDALTAARAGGAKGPVMYLSPQGRRFDQAAVAELRERPGMILLSGRYEGIDERVVSRLVDEEWSIGDYVLSGGELAAMAMIDAVVRTLPSVLGDARSAQEDSFAEGLLDYPHYTRPEENEAGRVPEVLLSGDHAAIRRWREKQALGRTWERRPDLLTQVVLSAEQQALLDEYRRERARQ